MEKNSRQFFLTDSKNILYRNTFERAHLKNFGGISQYLCVLLSANFEPKKCCDNVSKNSNIMEYV